MGMEEEFRRGSRWSPPVSSKFMAGSVVGGAFRFNPGTRKCSNCHEYKSKKDFNAEEEKKPASKRVCRECGSGLPRDLAKATVADLKKALLALGLATSGLKAELLARLQAAHGSNPPAPAPPPKPPADLPLPSALRELTVTRLQQELRKVGKATGGKKDELLARLSQATGVPVDEPVPPWHAVGQKRPWHAVGQSTAGAMSTAALVAGPAKMPKTQCQGAPSCKNDPAKSAC